MFAQAHLYFTTTVLLLVLFIFHSLFLLQNNIITIKINACFVTIFAAIKHVEIYVSHKFDYFVVTTKN